LRELSGYPVYEQKIEIKGKLSEPGSVTVFLNGKPKRTEPTASDGSFSIKVRLARIANYTRETTRTTLDTGISWKNKVKLEAVDAAGLKTTSEEVEIEYALCGEGTWITVELTKPLPNVLNPRLLLEGIQQVGFGYKYEYNGQYKAEINPRAIRVIKLQLAPEFQKDYDNGLVSVSTPPVQAQRGKRPTGKGYIQVNFQPILDPWELEGEEGPKNATMYDREKKVSEHRQSGTPKYKEGGCLTPGFGCMRLFLELEIPFTEYVPSKAYDPRVRQTLETEKPVTRTQKTCINVEIGIDKRIPPDYIPESFLESVRDILGDIIDGIDKVLKPIETIGKYLFYTCIAGSYLSFIPIYLEKYNCQYNKWVTLATDAEGFFEEKIAEIGACDEQYGAESKAGKNCKTCQDSKENRQWFERTYRQICDRVMCPAAPSLQYYLKTKGRQQPKVVEVNEKAKTALKNYAIEDKIYSGSDCGAWMLQNKVVPADKKKPTIRRIPPRVFFKAKDIQKIFTTWKDHEEDTKEETEGISIGAGVGETKVNCAGLHPATAECCGYEYMQEWSSACGVSALGSGLDFFDEIKESTCLSAQNTNKNTISDGSGGTIECNNIFNTLGGFCDKDGQPTLENIKVVQFSKERQEYLELEQYGKERFMYMFLIPQIGQNVGIKGEYDIKLGYLVETIEFKKAGGYGRIAESERHLVNAKLEAVELQTPESQGLREKHFKQPQIDAYHSTGETPPEFEKDLCIAAGNPRGCKNRVKGVYDQAMAIIGTPDVEYIIRPNDGLINSLRCLCFPTLIGYLKMWRNVLNAVRNCVNTILLTGDGEAGVCQAVVSQYACDLIYEALSCFTQKFSSGQKRAEADEGDILGALTSAGSEMSRSMEGRYGETGMYNTVFVERKLVHSICTWAFTGTWDIDLAAVFDQAVDEIPIASYALLTPCNRRFVSFNPGTSPPGLTTWVYHFGVGIAAGADVQVELKLKCSGGHKCRESDGFVNGQCDCPTETIPISIVPQNFPTRVRKNEILNEEVFYTMIGGRGIGDIRYDTAELVYTWKDGTKTRTEKATCSISQSGGPGAVPAFCRFEPLSGKFRCQWGEAEGGIRFTEAKANYPHEIRPGGKTFALNEEIDIELQIAQDYPGTDPKYNKYLEYIVTNVAGTEVAHNKGGPYITLATNGDYSKTIGSQPPIPIEKKWFEGRKEGTQQAIRQWSSIRPNAPSPNLLIEAVSLTPDQRKRFVVELTRVGTQVSYKVYGAGQGTTVRASGFVSKQASPVCTGRFMPTPARNSIVCTPTRITPVPGRPAPTTFSGTLVIDFTPLLFREQRPAAGETIQLHIDYGEKVKAGADPCIGENRYKPQQFKITFTAYDANKWGQPEEQISLDPTTGQDAVKYVTFQAVCAEATDPKFKEMEARVVGIVPGSELLRKLISDIDSMLAQEKTHKSDIEKWILIEGLISLKTNIEEKLNAIISQEPQNAAELSKHLLTIEKNTELSLLRGKVEDLRDFLREGPMIGPQPAPYDVPEFGIPEFPELPTTCDSETIVMQAKIAKKKLLQISSVGKISRDAIRNELRKILGCLNDAISRKESVKSSIGAITGETVGKLCPGEPGGKLEGDGNYYVCLPLGATRQSPWQPETRKCPLALQEQKCWKLPKENICLHQQTDSAGNYYECSDKAKEIPWQRDSARACTAGQQCWKLVKENLCPGVRDDYKYECKAESEPGWDESPVHILPTIPPAVPRITPLVCLSPDLKCFKTYFARERADILLGLKNIIQVGVKVSEEILRIPKVTSVEATEYLSMEGKNRLFRIFDESTNSIDEEIKALDAKLKESEMQTTDTIYVVVTNLIKKLGEVKEDIIDIKGDIPQLSQISDVIVLVNEYDIAIKNVDYTSEIAMDAINRELGTPGMQCKTGFGEFWERRCDAVCPASPFSELKWETQFRACDQANQKCCARASMPQFYDENGNHLSDEITTDKSEIQLTVKFPYKNKESIERIRYIWRGGFYTIQTSKINFDENNKIATVRLPELDFDLSEKDDFLSVDVMMGEIQPGNGIKIRNIKGITLCGNGRIDAGEVCDPGRGERGGVVVSDKITYGTYATETLGPHFLRWYTKDLGTAYQSTGVDLDNGFCYKFAGYDCNDKITYLPTYGKCTNNCKTFRPMVECIDADTSFDVDSGKGIYYGPIFDVQGKPKLTIVPEYIRSAPGSTTNLNECKPIHYKPPKDPPATASPNPELCGNGKRDAGELCDKKADGSIDVLSGDEWFSMDGTYVRWLRAGIPRPITYAMENVKFFCNNVISTDCTDEITVLPKKGWCSDSCMEYSPTIVCVDSDPFGDDGKGAYLFPKFYYDTAGVRRMDSVYTYKYSDPKSGSNPCNPSGTNPTWNSDYFK